MGKKRHIIRIYLMQCWKWNWVITLPVAVIFCLWIGKTAYTYYDFKLKYKPAMPISLWNLGNLQAHYMVSGLKEFIFPHRIKVGEGLDAIHLFIRESELRKLDSDLPYSGREYVKGKLLYPDGEFYNVKIKYRGDYSYHWSGRKKSLRIKTKKNRLYNGMRQFNLIIPKSKYVMAGSMSYLLADRMNILGPESQLEEVYINGKYIGVQLMVEQLGEQFLRRNGRMPGDLYVGEIVGRDAFPGVGREVFLNHGYWKKAAMNNHNPPEWAEALEELTHSVYKEEMDNLLDLIDIDSWGRFAAYITICQTVHFDSNHNWRLYFDPAKGKFEPIIWDPVGWWFRDFVKWISMQTNRMDIISNIIFERLHRDQRFLAAKHSVIESFFLTGGDQYLFKIMEDTDRLVTSVKGDRNLHFESTYLLHPNEVLKEIRTFKDKVTESLKDIRKIYLNTPPEAFYSVNEKSSMIQINVEGFTPIKSLEIEYETPVIENIGGDIIFKREQKLFSKDITQYISKKGRNIRLDIPLFAKRKMAAPLKKVPVIIRDVLIEPASYLLDIRGISNSSVRRITAVYADGKVITLNRRDTLEIYPLDGNFHIIPVEEAKKELVWGGEVYIEDIIEVEDNLTIEPGTTVHFSPGSAIVMRGKLYARGTSDKPIRFVPAKEGQEPWGAVILAGSSANGSVLSNCVLSNGSGIKHKLVEYSAMLSIHDVKDVMVESCLFSDGKIVDDMVHAVYSEITIKDSEFRNSLSDALDLDYVKGLVENSRFINSGNDALDLMSSQVVVTDSAMRGSGDKGISVGEGTDVFVWNTRLIKNEIGVQVKDRSKAILYNVEIIGNKRTIDAYKKNWQYGDGGHVRVYKSFIKGISPAITADKNSSVKIFDSFLDGGIGKKKKRIYIDDTVDSESDFTKKARSEKSYFDDLELHEFLRPSLGLADPTARGVK